MEGGNEERRDGWMGREGFAYMQDQCVPSLLLFNIPGGSVNDRNGESAVHHKRVGVLTRWWLHSQEKVLEVVESWNC